VFPAGSQKKAIKALTANVRVFCFGAAAKRLVCVDVRKTKMERSDSFDCF
jgi:hypothetical protein